MMFRVKLASCLSAMAIGMAATASPAASANNILYILDASNSMWGQMNGVPKIEIAKNVLSELLKDAQVDTKVGLLTYGHRVKDSCDDMELVSNIGASDATGIIAKLADIKPKGKTPIAGALTMSLEALSGKLENNNSVVLISDGVETCDGNACAAAKSLAQAGVNTKVHVVGFDLNEQEAQQLECVWKAGNGRYFSANTAEELKGAIAEVQQVAQAVVEPEPKVVEYFRDDFNGEDLGADWEIKNPDPDAYIVENGLLNILSSKEITLYDQSDEIRNLFILSKPLPKGDWTATIRLTPAVTTMRESFSIALYSDKDKFLVASALVSVATHAGNLAVTLFGRKAAKGQNTDFKKNIYYSKEALGHRNVTNKITAYTELAEKDLQAILLKIRKMGRAYLISGMFEGEAATADGQQPQWVDLQKLTSLRSPGKNLAISISQGKFNDTRNHLKGGETLSGVDWVKIETQE